MKKRTLYLTTGLLLVSILGVSTNIVSNHLKAVEAADNLNNIVDANESTELEKDIREVAFNQLSDEQKSFIQGSWEEATVENVVVEESGFELLDSSYLGKEVIAVNFVTDPYSEPGMMMVLLSEDTQQLIGYGLLL